jgi:hypothetical protein
MVCEMTFQRRFEEKKGHQETIPQFRRHVAASMCGNSNMSAVISVVIVAVAFEVVPLFSPSGRSPLLDAVNAADRCALE